MTLWVILEVSEEGIGLGDCNRFEVAPVRGTPTKSGGRLAQVQGEMESLVIGAKVITGHLNGVTKLGT